jgi:hypothetical protein
MVQKYVADLRSLLNQSIPASADAIRAMTGKIRIRLDDVPGKQKPQWIATFSPDFMRLLAPNCAGKEVSRSHNFGVPKSSNLDNSRKRGSRTGCTQKMENPGARDEATPRHRREPASDFTFSGRALDKFSN